MTWIKLARRSPRKMGSVLKENPLERAARLDAMRSFARALGVPEDDAAALYESELQYVAAVATVDRYVPLIAEKRAKAALHRGLRGRSGGSRS